MATGPGKTPTTLEIETELWKRSQIAAIKRDLSKRAMIEESLKLWLRHGEKPPDQITVPEEHPIHAATQEELEVAAAAVSLWREANPQVREMLDVMLRRYRGKSIVVRNSKK
jgi:hypothetical protein